MVQEFIARKIIKYRKLCVLYLLLSLRFDGGYALDEAGDGVFGELGVGAYFLMAKTLALNLGVKHYFGIEKTFLAIGFTVNFGLK